MADDPELDFCAETFDPVKALNSDNVVVPYPNVKALDNLARYETMLKASKAKPEAKPKSTEFKVNEASHPSHPDRIKERRAKMAAKRADKDPDDAVQAPKSKRRKARKTHLLDYLDGTASKPLLPRAASDYMRQFYITSPRLAPISCVSALLQPNSARANLWQCCTACCTSESLYEYETGRLS
eukprot:TRINITY_DN12458_c1_g1_i5.p2 TRINITY_DN12458_c1_g1~~TRINITY_DN12458_c1_g1_i5.p2  ORF type:complete len:183 (+),score=25.15 TRINITY_DN12458_c1_g1_i5:1441-1989(+)